MQINSIQTTQPNFGTRFKADHSTLDCLTHRPEMKKHFFKFIKELENNGRNDTLVLTQGTGEWDTSALVYQVIPAKNIKGYDKFKQGESVSFEIRGNLLSGEGVCSNKESINRIKEAYNKAYASMLDDCGWKNRADAEWKKYLI